MITLPPFKAFLASNIPSVYDNTLTYYEELVKLIAYLEQQVIPAVNKNTADIEEYKDGLKELKEYVDNYFDNLDIQTEINNKLDAMAQSGQLATIIAQFLDAAPVFAFGTINGLENATNLNDSTIARVIGNTAANAGDGAYYLIRTKTESDNPDGFNLVAVGDALVGERVLDANIVALNSSPINVKFYGAKGDGTTDDTQVIQNIINNNPRATLYFPSGNYLIRSGLKVNHKNPVSFRLEDDARLFTDTSLTCLLDLATDRDPDPDEHFHVQTDGYITRIQGGVFDCNYCQYGIRTQSSGARLWMNGCRLENVDYYGIYLNQDAFYSSVSANLQNLNIQGKTSASSNASTAIYSNGHDSKMFNISIVGTKIGIDLQSSGNYINTVHPVAQFGESNTFTTAQFNATVCFRSNGTDNTFVNCYADTYGTGFDIHQRMNTTLSNCFTYWWQSPNDAETYCVNFNDVYDPYATITGCNFKTAGHGTAHIIYHPSGTHYHIQLANNTYSTTNTSNEDLAYNVSLNNLNTVLPFIPPATQFTSNSHYLVGYIERGNFSETSFSISDSSTKYNINMIYVQAGATIHKGNIYGNGMGIDLVVGDPVTIGGHTYAKLYIKTGSTATWSQISITDVSGDALYIIPHHSKTAVSAPSNVLVYTSL